MTEEKQTSFAQPSYRWLARIIDLGLWTPLAYLVFVPFLLGIDAMGGGLVDEASKTTLTTITISGVVFLFLLMAIDAIVGAIFGNTPGKALMHISVSKDDGAQLTAGNRFKRNMGVATIGLGLSTLFLGWLLMLIQYFITRTGRKSTYDKAMGYSVTKSKRIEIWRGALCTIVFIVAMAFQTLSTKLANEVVNPNGWYIGLQAITETARNAENP
jgi:uncharacterized RDD family membrane protein YckC